MYELFSSRLKNSRLIVDSGSISEAFLKSWFELHHNCCDFYVAALWSVICEDLITYVGIHIQGKGK